INVTTFFRDSEAWKALAEDVIPRLVDEAGDSRSLRIWSAGCSAGGEPYTIAMLLAGHPGGAANNYTGKIYRTDIHEEALTAPRNAVYRTEQLKDIPDRLVDRYFTRDGQLYRFRRDIRRWCIFGGHNLTQAPPLSHIDLLVCRNVLIYFTSELQDRILTRFHYSIREDGVLFLGRSESLLSRSRLFAPLQLKWRIFQRTPSMSRQAPAVLPETHARHNVPGGGRGGGAGARRADPARARGAAGRRARHRHERHDPHVESRGGGDVRHPDGQRARAKIPRSRRELSGGGAARSDRRREIAPQRQPHGRGHLHAPQRRHGSCRHHDLAPVRGLSADRRARVRGRRDRACAPERADGAHRRAARHRHRGASVDERRAGDHERGA